MLVYCKVNTKISGTQLYFQNHYYKIGNFTSNLKCFGHLLKQVTFYDERALSRFSVLLKNIPKKWPDPGNFVYILRTHFVSSRYRSHRWLT